MALGYKPPRADPDPDVWGDYNNYRAILAFFLSSGSNRLRFVAQLQVVGP
jgi:hypothetical protein